ncbi:MAG: sulfite exporter TauE/SafE family protein, partial [Planctomycetes bacterium]|nr:sulfite exporter TauE/SafE family protein [Planctomycetota bacterium]
LFQRQDALGMVGLGLLNGLLPCGLVYVALAGAMAAGSASQGAVYMGLFGLGTVPMLLAIALGGPCLLRLVPRRQLRLAVPAAALLVGALFLVRGLDLGIPGLSPKFEESTQTLSCCSPDGEKPEPSTNSPGKKVDPNTEIQTMLSE